MPADLGSGDPVRLEFTKWGGAPHWQFDAIYLGADEAGDWLGFPVGSYMSRPGVEHVTSNVQVALVPAEGTDLGRAWIATFHGPGGPMATYVDMTSLPQWDGPTVRAVDLDLDVIEGLDRCVFVDDEDEFDEHRVDLGYPADIVWLARSTSAVVRTAVERRLAPFDGSADRWFAVLDRLPGRPTVTG